MNYSNGCTFSEHSFDLEDKFNDGNNYKRSTMQNSKLSVHVWVKHHHLSLAQDCPRNGKIAISTSYKLLNARGTTKSRSQSVTETTNNNEIIAEVATNFPVC